MSEYVQELESKLKSARERVRKGTELKGLKQSTPTLFEIIDNEISLAVNKMTQQKACSYEEYLSLHGQVVGIRRIRNVIDGKILEVDSASQEATVLGDQLKQFEDDKTTK